MGLDGHSQRYLHTICRRCWRNGFRSAEPHRGYRNIAEAAPPRVILKESDFGGASTGGRRAHSVTTRRSWFLCPHPDVVKALRRQSSSAAAEGEYEYRD
jgi:hypothetical protein